MNRQILINIAVLALVTASPAAAQTQTGAVNPPAAEGVKPISVIQPTHALLGEIVDWLAATSDLPAIHEYPRIEFVRPDQLARMRYRGLLSKNEPDSLISPQSTPSDDVLAIYDSQTKTIFLAEGWTGATPAERSILVHEMVHHLQYLGDVKYDCPAAREKPAYRAQNNWLHRHGLDLEQAFELDLFSIFIKSSCMY